MKINLSAIIAIARKLPPGRALRFVAKAAQYAKGGFTRQEVASLADDLLGIIEMTAGTHGDDVALDLVLVAAPLLNAVAQDNETVS